MKIRIYTTDNKNWFVQELESGHHLHHEKSRTRGKQRCEEWLSKYLNHYSKYSNDSVFK